MKALPTLTLAIAAVLGSSGAMAQYVWQAREAANPAPAATSAQPSQGSGAGLMISVDPATGRIRPPEQEEMRALTAQQLAALQSAPPLVTFTAPGGAVGIRLGPSFDSYLVAKKWGDGAVDVDCLPTEAQAIEAMSTRAKPAGTIQKKAVLDDR